MACVYRTNKKIILDLQKNVQQYNFLFLNPIYTTNLLNDLMLDPNH
jgi:hypothetical protein